MGNAIVYKFPILFPSLYFTVGKQSINIINVLPRLIAFSHQNAMAAPREVIQLLEVFRQTGSQWIQVDIPDQFLEIRLFLTQNGFVAILKKLPVTLVFSIEPARVSRKKAAHENRNGGGAGPEQ